MFQQCKKAFHNPILRERARSASRAAQTLSILLFILPVAAHAQSGGTPFDTGFTAIQTLFTGTIAKVASLVAIVIGGYGFAHGDPVVEAAIDQRRQFFETKRDHLYQVEIFYAIILEGPRSKSGVGAALARLFRDPAGAIGELRTQFTSNSMKTLLRSQIEGSLSTLEQKVRAFSRQFADFMQIEILSQQAQFRFFRRLLNYDEWCIAGKPQSTQFLDYQVVNSDIEAERSAVSAGLQRGAEAVGWDRAHVCSGA